MGKLIVQFDDVFTLFSQSVLHNSHLADFLVLVGLYLLQNNPINHEVFVSVYYCQLCSSGWILWEIINSVVAGRFVFNNTR